ncbi:MAG TPA: amidohydrolase family protein [Thermoanaerobaculia bacterium]|nr:amidohydrolase family protein [Thermoanaerobaculia bacterium]
MKLWLILVLLFLGSCTSGNAPDSREAAPSSEEEAVTVFFDVDVVPMDGERILRHQAVMIRGDRILSVAPSESVRVPRTATVIEATGKYLIPGLAEMHGHIPPPSAPQDFIDSVLFLYVANGITTVRGMLGWPGQLELREKANRGEIVAPTLYLAGPSFSGNSINSAEEAIEKVRQQKAEGWNLLKVHPGLTRAEFDAMARTAREVGMRFGGHVPQEVGLMHAIEMGQETFDHLDGYLEHLDGFDGPLDEARLQEAVARTREAGAWVIPTMALWEVLYGALDLETLRSYPELKYMPADQVAQWITAHHTRLNNSQLTPELRKRVVDNRMRLLGALNRGGVGILMGTDAPQQFSVPGFSLHRELERMRDAGMTPYEIIRSGTYNVGVYFRNEDDFGTIEPGKRADLVLLDANPLEDIANVARRAGVMVRGRWLSEEEIQRRLAAIAR